MTLWLSERVITQYPALLPSLSTTISFTPFVNVIYSTWVVDKATTDCKLAFQQTAIRNSGKKITQKSTYRYQIPYIVYIYKPFYNFFAMGRLSIQWSIWYYSFHISTSQWAYPRSAMNLLITLIACAKSDLLHTIQLMMIPTTLAYAIVLISLLLSSKLKAWVTESLCDDPMVYPQV